MACACVWFLCAVLSVLIMRGKQDAQRLTAPEEVDVDTEDDLNDLGVWKMTIKWKHGFTNRIIPDTVTYDINIFYTEQMKLVHNETIGLKADQMGRYNWSWTSPLPLQCTSHSVQLRYRDRDHTSAWTPLKILPGKDIPVTKDIKVYPQNHVALVSEGIRFCCILKPDHAEHFRSPAFTIRISNRTYVTKPIRHPYPSPPQGFDITCETEGASYYTGYAPTDHSITCETRDLSSVECRWIDELQANISKTFRRTDYSINGRNCTPGYCVLDNDLDTGVMNWTLIAKNTHGTKIIFDTADPKHRVHLKAPTLNTRNVTARSATLLWIWSRLPKYSYFSMICQVEVNGHITKERFQGTGLTSVVLANLQPFTEYKVRVQCGSNEHFYKWGDWSNYITFNTKEDIPEPVDVWMQVFGEQTYVVWKTLSAGQSHGIITGYKLVMESSADGNKDPISKSPTDLCHELQAGSAKTYHVVTVSAENSAGVSRPSDITIPNMSTGAGVDTSDIKGNNGTFDLVWERSSRFTCGYVVDWYPTYEAQQCGVKWKKIPSDDNDKILSDYKDYKVGVKYTLSVYGCTSGASYTLLQRRAGYVAELRKYLKLSGLCVSEEGVASVSVIINEGDVASVSVLISEEAPSGTVQNIKAKQEGVNIFLSWKSVHEPDQRGFIKGYHVSYSCDGGNERKVIISDPKTQMYKLKSLPGTYTYTVRAFTSAGDGPGSMVTLLVEPQDNQVIINVVAGLVVMIFVFCIIAVLAYRNWKQLRSVLWPEIPKPELSEEFPKNVVYQCQVLNHLLCEESEMLKVKNLEIYPVLTAPQPENEHHEAQALITPHSKDSPCTHTVEYQTPNSKPQTLPPITVDLSYKELSYLVIQNPTYSLPLMSAGDDVLGLGYIPQEQNSSIQQ